MDGWTVTVTIAGRLDVEAAEDLEVTLHSHGPAIALGDDEWSVTLAIDADAASDALAAGHHAIRLIEEARGSVEVVGLEVMTWTEHDRQLAEPAYPPLVGMVEVAAHLGVSKSRISELQGRPGFPQPVQVLASGPVWPRAWIENLDADWERREQKVRES